MRKKFKIMYPEDHQDREKRGKQFKPEDSREMIVVNEKGIFFLYHGEYYPWIQPLREVISKYDIIWE